MEKVQVLLLLGVAGDGTVVTATFDVANAVVLCFYFLFRLLKRLPAFFKELSKVTNGLNLNQIKISQ